MGGYACLELASRWQYFFCCAVPISAYYEDDIDALACKLAEAQALPVWFFHSANDRYCPYPPIERLVKKLRCWTSATIHHTVLLDKWSKSGHDIECVAYPNLPEDHILERPAMGDEVFAWILQQQRKPPPRRVCDQCERESVAGRDGWGEGFVGKWYCSTCWPYWE